MGSKKDGTNQGQEWEQLRLFDVHPACDDIEPAIADRVGVGAVDDSASFYDDKVLRASEWIWMIHPERVIGICPDCGLGIQVRVRSTSDRTVELVDEAERLHQNCSEILAPTLLLELYGVGRIAHRFGFPAELIPPSQASA